MSATQIAPKLLSWASDIETGTVDQARRTAQMSFVAGHVALMPDAHVGFGSTVGSVIPTEGAIMPAAVGVDIGCGMVAAETTLTAGDLPDSLGTLMPLIAQRIPAGVGKGHGNVDAGYDALGLPNTELSQKQATTAALQFGTLGSGNHFLEVCLDERDVVWTVLHSGSRGIGNQLAKRHIEGAKGLMKERLIGLPDPDLAYFVESDEQFGAYIEDMLWAQRYAMGSRQVMSGAANASLFQVVGHGAVKRTINCHHNFTQREHHHGRDTCGSPGRGRSRPTPGISGSSREAWERGPTSPSAREVPPAITPRATVPDGDSPRGAARRALTVDSLREAMVGKEWLEASAEALLDEHPLAYKDIEAVMADQADLVGIQHTLHQVFNYKGH